MFIGRWRRIATHRGRPGKACEWTCDKSEGLLQLETYASDGTTSQVLQIDQQRAGELMGIIAQVFPALYLPQPSRSDEER